MDDFANVVDKQRLAKLYMCVVGMQMKEFESRFGQTHI